MKQFLIIILSLIFLTPCTPQEINLSKLIGGSNTDFAYEILESEDQNFIIFGESKSSNGDMEENNGATDIWICKVNELGEILWSKNYGYTSGDRFKSAIHANDGGFIVCGYRNSIDGNILNSDFWIFKIDEEGELIWEEFFGDEGKDNAYSIISLGPNGYYLSGTNYNPEELEEYLRVMRLNNTGKLLWEKKLFRHQILNPSYLCLAEDGGVVIATSVSDINNNTNYEIIKLSSLGMEQWHKTYGGGLNDWPYSIIRNSKDHYVVIGAAASSDGDIDDHRGSFDIWLVELDSNGELLGTKSLGGSKSDIGYRIYELEDQDYMIVGISDSSDGDVTGHTDKTDAWIIKMDKNFNIIWQFCIGDASGTDRGRAGLQISDGKWLITGYTNSNQGLFTENRGKDDIWLFELFDHTSHLNEKSQVDEQIVFPNPTRNYIQITAPGVKSYTILDADASLIQNGLIQDKKIMLTEITPGVYTLILSGEGKSFAHKFIVHRTSH